MNEKRKQGLGEEAKNGFISCFMSLLILISIPVGVLLLCFVIVVIYGRDEVTKAVAEIQPVVREVCDLPDYEADRLYYSWLEMNYFHRMEEEQLYTYCWYSSEEWQCDCDELD